MLSRDDQGDGQQRRVAVSRRIMRGFDPARLIDARDTAEVTRPDLARLSGVSVSSIQRWERGDVSPQVDALARVAQILEVKMEDFISVPHDERFPGDWRVLRGLTQPQLGALAGVSTSIVGRVERGEVSLAENVAIRLAAALGIPTAELRAAYERSKRRPFGMPA